jgi:CheY-like chemotaxis protein
MSKPPADDAAEIQLGDPISASTDAPDTPKPASQTNTTQLYQSEKPETSGDTVSNIPYRKIRAANYLLVDDNAINLRILMAYMTKLGHTYETASDGLEALRTFKKGGGKYKCVFMDISMPVMDGFEATRAIRAYERENSLRRCNIYALTGLASASAQREAFSSGIDLCLAKPVKLKELSGILESKSEIT